jgi:hypothetical protein
MNRFPGLKVGDVVLLRSNYVRTRDRLATVSKVGRAYFHLEGDRERYRLSDGRSGEGSYFFTAWPSEAAYLADREHHDRCESLALYCRNPSVLRSLSPEQLDRVGKIVGFGAEGRSIDG